MTPRQKQVLDYIKDYHEVRGYAPTFSLIMDYCGITSKSSVHRILKGLEQQRLIQRNPSRARGIILIDPAVIPSPTMVEAGAQALRGVTADEFQDYPELVARVVYMAMRKVP